MLVKDLQGILSRVKTALDSKGFLDTHGQLCFMDKKVKAFDGTVGCISAIDLDLTCCVDGDAFVSQVAKLDKDGEVELGIKNNQLHIQSGNLRAKLRISGTEDFPDFVPTDRSILIDNDPYLFPALEAAADFMGKEANALGGVCIVGDAVYTCNEKTATKAVLSKSITDIIHVPARFVNAILEFGEPNFLFRARDLVGAFYPDSVIITSQIVSRFPYEQINSVFEVDLPEEVLPTDLDKALKRIGPSLVNTEAVTLSSTNGVLSVATGSPGSTIPDSSDGAAETIPWTGPDFKCSVNLKRLQAVLKRTSKVRLGSVMSDNPRALLFIGDNFLHALALQD